MDLSKISSKAALTFLEQYLRDRKVNRDFFQLVPDSKLDFRMTPKSDSIRESMAHQIDTERDYINSIKTGELKFGIVYPDLEEPAKLTKELLLSFLDQADNDLIKVLADPGIDNKKVKVPWGSKPVTATNAIWGLDSHEILHQGWNLALMDHLGIGRYPSLKQMWG